MVAIEAACATIAIFQKLRSTTKKTRSVIQIFISPPNIDYLLLLVVEPNFGEFCIFFRNALNVAFLTKNLFR